LPHYEFTKTSALYLPYLILSFFIRTVYCTCAALFYTYSKVAGTTQINEPNIKVLPDWPLVFLFVVRRGVTQRLLNSSNVARLKKNAALFLCSTKYITVNG